MLRNGRAEIQQRLSTREKVILTCLVLIKLFASDENFTCDKSIGKKTVFKFSKLVKIFKSVKFALNNIQYQNFQNLMTF